MDTCGNDADPGQLSVGMNMLIGDLLGAANMPAPHAGAAKINRAIRLQMLIDALRTLLDDVYAADDDIIELALNKVRMGLGVRHACSFPFAINMHGLVPDPASCMRRCFLQAKREADRIWEDDLMDCDGPPSVLEQQLEQQLAALMRGENESVVIHISRMENELNHDIARLQSNIATPPNSAALHDMDLTTEEYVQAMQRKVEQKTLALRGVPEAAMQQVLLLPISCTILFPSCRPPSVHRM